MFRKTFATLLAIWFPLSFSIQGCARGANELTPIGGAGTLGNINTLSCEAQGDKDTDNDGLCDRVDTGDGLIVAPGTTKACEGEACAGVPDVNANNIDDGKETWFKSNWYWVVGGALVSVAGGWMLRGNADGHEWRPFDFGGENTSSGLTVHAGETIRGNGKIKLEKNQSGVKRIAIINDATVEDLWVVLPNNTGIQASGVKNCIHAPYEILEPANAANQTALLRIQIPTDYMENPTLEGLMTSAEFHTLCNEGRDGAYTGLANAEGTHYYVSVTPISSFAKPTTDRKVWVAYTRLKVYQANSQTIEMSALNANNPAIETVSLIAQTTPAHNQLFNAVDPSGTDDLARRNALIGAYDSIPGFGSSLPTTEVAVTVDRPKGR